MKKRYNSIASDRKHMINGDKPVKNFYACDVGHRGIVSNQHRIMISIDKAEEKGLRVDEIDDLSHHSTLDLNPLTEWIPVTVAYFPKKSNPFRFYFL